VSLPLSPRQRLLGIAALLLATSSWGGMFLVSKGVLHHVEPVWFTLIRYSMSALLFVLLILPRGMAPWPTSSPPGSSASLRLPNRIVIAPMCQYSAEEGSATDWHMSTWATSRSRAPAC
jgi:drug/metabolite transporter (DMT)-like permease